MRLIFEDVKTNDVEILNGIFGDMLKGTLYGSKYICEIDKARFYNSKVVESKNNRSNIVIVESLIVRYRDKNNWSFQKIADSLNKMGYKTSRNKEFKKMTVKRVYDGLSEAIKEMILKSLSK